MNNNFNDTARAASEQLQALAHQEKAMLNNVLSAIKSAFSSEPEITRSVQAWKDRGGELSHSALATISRYPVAAALSVVGLGALIYGLRRSGSSTDNWDAYHQSSASYGVDPEYIDDLGEPLPASTSEQVSSGMQRARERYEELAPQAREYARSARDRASEMAREAGSSAQAAGRQFQSRSQQLSDTARNTVREHPVAAGIIGVALGVAVGGALYGSSRRSQPSYKALQSKGFDMRDFSRAISLFNAATDAAKQAMENSKKRIMH